MAAIMVWSILTISFQIAKLLKLILKKSKKYNLFIIECLLVSLHIIIWRETSKHSIINKLYFFDFLSISFNNFAI